MKAWNPTWRHQHIPRWFAKVLNTFFRKHGEPPGEHLDYLFKVERGFFNHWGAVKIKGETCFITQPYGNIINTHRETMAWAKALGCNFRVYAKAPWSDSRDQCLVVFREKKKRQTKPATKKGIKWRHTACEVYFYAPGLVEVTIHPSSDGLRVSRYFYNPAGGGMDLVPDSKKTWPNTPEGLEAAKRDMERWMAQESAKLTKKASKLSKLLSRK